MELNPELTCALDVDFIVNLMHLELINFYDLSPHSVSALVPLN